MNRPHRICFATMVLVALALRWLFDIGPVTGWDDAHYSHFAATLAQGAPLPLDSYYYMRYCMTLPIAFSYFLFGVNPVALALPFALASVAAMALLVIWGRAVTGKVEVGLLAAAVYAFIPVAVTYGMVPWPSVPRTVIWTLGFYLMYRAEREPERRRTCYVAAGLVLALAYFLNLYEVMVLGVLGLYGAYLVYRKTFTRDYLWVIGIVLAAIALESLVYLAGTGQISYRWKIAFAKGVHDWNQITASTDNIYLSRFWQFCRSLWHISTFGPFGVLALIGIYICRRDRAYHMLYIWTGAVILGALPGMVVYDIGGARFMSSIFCPVAVFAAVALWRLGRERLLVGLAVILMLAPVAMLQNYVTCTGTTLTRNRPWRVIAEHLDGKTGQVWTDPANHRILAFYQGYRSPLTHVNVDTQPDASQPCYAVWDEAYMAAITQRLQAGEMLPIKASWLMPPTDWELLATVSHYRPYPGPLGDFVRKRRGAQKRPAIRLYRVPSERR